MRAFGDDWWTECCIIRLDIIRTHTQMPFRRMSSPANVDAQRGFALWPVVGWCCGGDDDGRRLCSGKSLYKRSIECAVFSVFIRLVDGASMFDWWFGSTPGVVDPRKRMRDVVRLCVLICAHVSCCRQRRGCVVGQWRSKFEVIEHEGLELRMASSCYFNFVGLLFSNYFTDWGECNHRVGTCYNCCK